MKRRLVGALVATAVLALVGLFLLHAPNDFSDNHPGAPFAFEIGQGELGSSIAHHLVSSGVIKDAGRFIQIFSGDATARAISPGIHLIQTHISSKRAISQLLDPTRIQGLIKIREGSTFKDLLRQLRASRTIDMTTPVISSITPTLPNPAGSWEGQLAPVQYSFPSHTSSSKAIASMSAAFAHEIASIHLAQGVPGFTAYQNLTIASMVQIEGDNASFGKVARVIVNRLKIGMPLQLNSTVQYAQGTQGSITLSRNATQRPSAYNTYLHVGLPPTPISFPSVAALQATLSPTAGDWLYFITVKPGDTRFTSHYDEFEGWVTLFNSNVYKGLFK